MNLLISSINWFRESKRIDLLNIILPVGISFYIFQAIGYVIDVYRRDIDAEHNIVDYFLFISFFPQLVAGPIERAKYVLPQLKKISEVCLFDENRLWTGVLTIWWGLFEKIVIADRLAVIVDEIYGNYTDYGAIPLMFATISFSFQIYCDFDGYSNMARGLARMMGVELHKNFRQPYFALDIVDFWKRWHLTLTDWFRDYIYIPLGGNRLGRIRQQINIVIVFSLSGFWHGAGWNYVIWGTYNGLCQCATILLKSLGCMSDKTNVFSQRLIKRLLTFIIVTIGWFFFRVKSVAEAGNMLLFMKGHVGDFSMISQRLDVSNWRILFLGLIMLLIVDILHEESISIWKFIQEQQWWFRFTVYIGLFVGVFYLGVNSVSDVSHSFIYFQF